MNSEPLPSCDVEDLVPVLIRLLDTTDSPRLKEEVIAALWKTKDSRAATSLLAIASQEGPLTVREKAVRGLGLMKAMEALPLLQSLVRENKNPLLRQAAAQALGCFDREEEIDFLIEAYRDPSWDVRLEILKSLGRFFRRRPECLHPAGLRLLKKVIRKEKEPRLRAEAVLALHYSRAPWVEKWILSQVVCDPSWLVRGTVYRSGLRWDSPLSFETLKKGMEDSHWEARKTAAACLTEYIGCMEKKGKETEALLLNIVAQMPSNFWEGRAIRNRPWAQPSTTPQRKI